MAPHLTAMRSGKHQTPNNRLGLQPTHGRCGCSPRLFTCGERGRVGERYAIVNELIRQRDFYAMASESASTAETSCSMRKAYVFATIAEIINRFKGFKDAKFCRTSMFLSEAFGPMSHEKASAELGWTPAPSFRDRRRCHPLVSHTATSDAIGVDREEDCHITRCFSDYRDGLYRRTIYGACTAVRCTSVGSLEPHGCGL